jgi:hypothetical protein
LPSQKRVQRIATLQAGIVHRSIVSQRSLE